MITLELLNGNDVLKGLTDEQKGAITSLSETNENEVIGNRFGEVYRQMDATIKEATGIDRNGDEKTYVYLKRAANAFADKYKDYDELKGKVSDLSVQLEKAKEGADEATKAQLAGVQKELETAKAQYASLKSEYDGAEEKHKSEMLSYRIDNEIARAKEGLKIKAGLNEFAVDALVSKAIANIKANNPAFETRNGQDVLIFHEADGTPMLNKENALNPYTTKELLTKELDALGILDNKATKGAGGKGNLPTEGTLSGVSTQTDATKEINRMLAERGIAKTSPMFQTEFNKIWNENEISKLPMR
jgi:predicted HicB family RNase H-like nuclease